MEIKEKPIKPILRWAGGKSWIVRQIHEMIPREIGDYYEPFIGGASIFLNINFHGRSFLSDYNKELITFYSQLRDNLENLIYEISKLENTEDNFYKIRDTKPRTELNIAARFYFLNRTCFNGLYRVNSKGLFNVPYGYRNVQIMDVDLFYIISNTLNNSTFKCCDFELALVNVKKGDFVFLDPPYTVAHNKNGFIEYNQKIFSWQDQVRLSQVIKKLINKDVFFIMTNANHDSIKNLYKGIGKQFEIERFSTIGGQESSRFKISELLVTNCI